MKFPQTILLLCLLITTVATTPITAQITYLVNTTDDLNDGVCDASHCSLREAIVLSNTDNQVSTIHFNISGSRPHVISPTTDYPAVADITIIDATSQANYALGDIIIDGIHLENEDGLWIAGNDCELYGLQLRNFRSSIYVTGSNCVIGTQNKGNLFTQNVSGVLINSGNCSVSHNHFGTNAAQEDLGNYNIGLYVQGQPTFASHNTFGFNREGIVEATIDGTATSYQENLFVCNGDALNLRVERPAPIIITSTPTTISGTATPNETIDIYLVDRTTCEGIDCQGSSILATVVADNNGDWTSAIANTIGTVVTATSRDANNKHTDFSNCAIINTCTTSNLFASIAVPSEVLLGSTYILDGQAEDGTTPYINHAWYYSSPNGLVNITNNNDGTATIEGTRVGWITIHYEVTDAEGCTYSAARGIYVDVDCSTNLTNPNTIQVVNTNDTGIGSLRHALNCANANTDIDNIHFNIPGNGPHIIYLESSLPDLYDQGIIIDGTTQPNYQLGDIILDGSNQASASFALRIYGEDFELYGLHIRKFSSGITIQHNSTIGALNKGNLFTENIVGIQLSLSNAVTPNSSINYNYIGTNPAGDDLGNLWEGINLQNTAAHISHNVIAYNQRRGIYPQVGENIRLSENRLFCNKLGIELNAANLNKASPSIQNITDFINGIAEANDTIELFLADDICPYSACQGSIFLGATTADATGNWSFPTPSNLSTGDRLTATASDLAGNTSPFSDCFIVLPDNCAVAEPLTVNDASCSTTGIVLDLKQMTDSEPTPTSICAATYAGKDAWYTVTIPATGNLLVRTNINNTVQPVIEAYTGNCGNLVLQQCGILDSLPYAMVFENYTVGTLVYLRVWDKDNTLTDSENTALLHLTAHELPLLKDDWEICDQENNLINGNPTILSERDANTFILEYDSTSTPEEIEQIEAELKAMGDSLLAECLCGGTNPLQLWKTDNPIDLEDRKRSMKKRPKTHNPNYNYVFEALEFQVNAYAIGQQYAPDVAMNTSGDFAIVWTDEQRRHNYGRIYKSSGNPITQEFQMGASDRIQFETSIAMDETGDFIVVWQEALSLQSNTYQIYGRQYNKDGTPKGLPFNISTTAANTSTNTAVMATAQYGTYPKVASDAQGNFLVVWHNQAAIYAQAYDSAGNLSGTIVEIGIETPNNINPNPSIAVNDTGDFIVVWSGADQESNGIYAQRFNASSQELMPAFLVNTNQEKNQTNPDIAIGEDSSFILVWESFEQEGVGLDYGVYGQRFDANSNKIGTSFLINTYQTDAQRHPSISLFKDGTFAVAWSSFGQDGFEEGIFGQFFDNTGAPIGQEFQMNALDESEQIRPQLANNSTSVLVSVWQDGANDGSYSGIFGQRYEVIESAGNKVYYPIGTATPSTLLGDELSFPTQIYQGTTTGNKVKVAIVDTGLDKDHPYLANAQWNNPNVNDAENCVLNDSIGYDFLNRQGTPIDLDGHGTKINGIVSRNFDSNVQLELMNLKFHELGKGKVFDAICAIYYAVNNGATVLNLSWGFEASEFPDILYKAIKYASDNDVLIITTAGNTSKDNDKINKFPANFNVDNLITVTAYEYKQSTGGIKLANYASYGQQTVDIAAYGFVESPTIGGGLEVSAGTSLAAPAVANTAATIKGLYPVLSAADIKDCILSSAQQVSSLSDKVATGGILDQEMALACAEAKADSLQTDDCQEDLLVNDIPIATGTYQSSTFLSSSGIIYADTNVLFTATESILLEAGFFADAGAIFTALIEPCTMSVTITSEVEKIQNKDATTVLNVDKEISTPENIEVVFYPNPANHSLTIDIENLKKEVALTLLDVAGKKIFSKKISAYSTIIPLNTLSPGMYFLHINEQQLGKVVISR